MVQLIMIIFKVGPELMITHYKWSILICQYCHYWILRLAAIAERGDHPQIHVFDLRSFRKKKSLVAPDSLLSKVLQEETYLICLLRDPLVFHRNSLVGIILYFVSFFYVIYYTCTLRNIYIWLSVRTISCWLLWVVPLTGSWLFGRGAKHW